MKNMTWASGVGLLAVVAVLGLAPGARANVEVAAGGPYVSDAPRVGFSVPEGFRAVATPLEEGTEVIVVERDATAGFQVFRTPHDEPALTPERIRLDLPDLVMEGLQEVDLGGTEALAFHSTDPDIGPTYEVWCVHGGYLYQLMARADFEAELKGILKTWRFLD